jgi:hypothetical protein
MIIAIDTQDLENYAAHQGFTGEYYWKAKGGSTVKVTNVPDDLTPEQIQEVVDSVAPEIEHNCDYFRTYILSFTTEANDFLSWFEKSQLEYDGEIVHREPEIDYDSIPDLVAVRRFERDVAVQQFSEDL